MADNDKDLEFEEVETEADIETEEETGDDENVVDLDVEPIELVDEDGNVLTFKLLDVTEYKGVKYALLIAAERNDMIADDEVVIFRLNEAEQTLEPVEDENLLQEVFDFYNEETEDMD